MKNHTRQKFPALSWIIATLRKKNIPYQITGGLAARVYGSPRPLADIDIEMKNKHVHELERSPDVQPYITTKATRYKNSQFSLLRMTLNYKGQDIDICGTENQQLYNKKTRRWERCAVDLTKATKKKAYRHILPVVPREELIRYKQLLSRKVDKEDVRTVMANRNH